MKGKLCCWPSPKNKSVAKFCWRCSDWRGRRSLWFVRTNSWSWTGSRWPLTFYWRILSNLLISCFHFFSLHFWWKKWSLKHLINVQFSLPSWCHFHPSCAHLCAGARCMYMQRMMPPVCFLEQKCGKVLLCHIPALVSPPCHWSNRGRERSLNSLGSRRRIENTAHYGPMCFTAELVHLRASPEAPTSTVCRWKAHKLVSVLRWISPRWNVAGKLGVRL